MLHAQNVGTSPVVAPPRASAGTFPTTGRKLLENGYLIVPIKPGHKSPANDEWQTARFDPSNLDNKYAACGTGILCGQGPHPIVAIDIDIPHDAALVERIADLCRERFGPTIERVGNAPKLALLYRAAEGGKKLLTAWFEDAIFGDRMRVEVLDRGQQIVVDHIHPDTGEPYTWTDLFGGIAHVPASALPVVTHEQIAALLVDIEALIVEAGHGCVTTATAPVDGPARPRREPEAHDFFGRTNAAAMAALAAWVPALLPAARPYHDGFRVSSKDLGRDLEEELSIVPAGIVDFGVHDMGTDPRHGKRTPIDLVLEWAHLTMDDLAIMKPIDAALWLCEQMDVKPANLGFGMRRESADADAGDLSDVRTARMLADLLVGEFLHEHNGRDWLRYSGGAWKPASRGEHVEAAKRLGSTLLAAAARAASDGDRDEAARLSKLAPRAMSAAGIKAALQLSESDPRLAADPGEFDRDFDLFNCANGTVHLPTGELLAHDPARRLSRQSPIAYDPQARCPLWDRTMHEIGCADPTWVDYVQRAVGYTLSGHVREEKVFFWIGVGANGKSVIANVLNRIFGSYATTAGANFLMASKRDGEGATPTLASLPGVRLALANEIEGGSRLSAQTVKITTSTEPIAARHPYGRPFVFVPTHKVHVRGNHKPIIADNDEGIWRRIVLIPFERHFAEHERDRALESKLMDEAPGILAWAVRGFRAYQDRGLSAPPRIAEASRLYRHESDLIGQWLADCATLGPGEACNQRIAFETYHEWCGEQGVHAFTKRSFTRSLAERGIGEGRRSTGNREHIYVGLSVHGGGVGEF